MLSGALLSFLTGLVAEFLKGALADWRRDRELKSAGRNEGALETAREIQEAADGQHQNDMRDRGDASAVARRLRERIRAGGAEAGGAEG